ncbi:MAG: M23 family metallopeptidase [Rubrobacter sp.]
MAGFGWTRLAYLIVTLVMLTLLPKIVPFVAASPEETSAAQIAATASIEEREETTTTDPITQLTPQPGAEVGVEVSNPSLEREPEDATEKDHDQHGKGGVVSGLYENVDFETEAPVFYRPVPEAGQAVASRETSPARSNRSSDGKVCKNVNAAPPGARIIFPLTREYFDTYEDTWGAARPQGGHEGTDLMAPDGTPLLAMTDATVVPVSGANSNGWNTLGGYTVMLRADYSIGPVKEGDLFYHAHMNRPANFEPGDTVEVGDVVGYVGDTGEGPEVTSGNFPSHLHLGWYDTGGARSQVASGAMNPYPLLEWVEANGGSIKGGSDIPYCEAPQTDAPTPAGGGSWQFPTNPGVRPDLDTGSESPAPSPSADPTPSSRPDNDTNDGPANRPTNRPGNGQAAADRPPDAALPNGPRAAIVGEEPSARAGGSSGTTDRGDAVPDEVISGDAATAEPNPNASSPGTQNGNAIENTGSPSGNANNASGRPFEGFWKLSRDEKVLRLLRLEKLGVDISRFERWLDRALGQQVTGPNAPEPDASESTTLNLNTTPNTEKPDTGKPKAEKPEENLDNGACQTRNDTVERGGTGEATDRRACQDPDAGETPPAGNPKSRPDEGEKEQSPGLEPGVSDESSSNESDQSGNPPDDGIQLAPETEPVPSGSEGIPQTEADGPGFQEPQEAPTPVPEAATDLAIPEAASTIQEATFGE